MGFREVVRPSFDTRYAVARLDLTKAPMIVSAADTEGRYDLLPMLDLWSDVFAVPGKRTSGASGGELRRRPPRWTEEPASLSKRTPLPLVPEVGFEPTRRMLREILRRSGRDGESTIC